MASPSGNNDRISALCERLVASSQAADDAVREFVRYYPAGRQDAAALSRELGDLRMTAGLLQRNDEDAAGQQSAPAAPNVRASVVGVARCALRLVDQLVEVVRCPDRSREGWLQEVAGNLSDLAKPTEILRLALDLASDALLFADSQPPPGSSDLPPYQVTQIIQMVVNIRARATDNNEQTPEPALLELLDSVQQFVEQTSSSLAVPAVTPNGIDAPAPTARSDAVSVHSAVHPPPAPPVEMVPITYPTPESIGVRHLFKTETGLSEILEVYLHEHQAKPVVAVSTTQADIKTYDLKGHPITTATPSWGICMRFCDGAPVWAFLTDRSRYNRANTIPYNQHMAVEKPAMAVYNRLTGRKLAEVATVHARPLAFSKDGSRLAVTAPGGRISFMEYVAPSANQVSHLVAGAFVEGSIHCLHVGDVTHGVFTPDSRAFVSISRDGTIRMTDPVTSEPLAKLDVNTWKPPQFLSITPDGHVIISIWGDTVYRWEYLTGSLDTYVLGERRRREGRPIAVSADCRFLACSTHDGVDISDLHTGRRLQSIVFRGGYVTAASFSYDGRYLALGKSGKNGLRVVQGTLDLWELQF
ncbi:ribosome assembly [Paramyrothecium foliicola]|nr:ribosome assembly [Paramyrothecium foliicola]